MKITISLVFATLLLNACQQHVSPKIENNADEIHKILTKQQTAWSEGNLDGFMDHYWKSDSLCFLSKNGLNCGWQKIYDNYRKGYSSKEEMGRLDFEILRSENFNDSTHFTVGRWKVSREADTLSGSFNLLWKLKDGEWKIVFDHTS